MNITFPFAFRPYSVYLTVQQPPPDMRPPNHDDLPFTLADIRGRIPKRCFEADMVKSVAYIALDVAKLAACVVVVAALRPFVSGSTVLAASLWLLYSFIQGTTSFGLWVIGHECGHQAYFGHRRILNDVVGFIIHTFYLAPYFSWKYTHATHHRYTNLNSMDTVYVPGRSAGLWHAIGEAFPPAHLVPMFFYLAIGWPMYLLTYVNGNPKHFPASHFSPWAPMFQPKERFFVVLSDVGIACALAAVGAASYVWGATEVAYWYGGSVFFNYVWLVLVTFLQHTDARVTHYDDSDGWTFLKGALSTVDRDYGIFNSWMHHITDGHVVHHMFSTMPFYHAEEVTPIIKEMCGEHYLTDGRPLPIQLWSSWLAFQHNFVKSKTKVL